MVMLLLYITHKRFFFLLALVVPRPELGDGRGGGVIYTRSFWSLFFIHITMWTLEREGFWKKGKGWVFWLEIGQDMMCVCLMYYIYTRDGGSGSKAEGRRRRTSTIRGLVL